MKRIAAATLKKQKIAEKSKSNDNSTIPGISLWYQNSDNQQSVIDFMKTNKLGKWEAKQQLFQIRDKSGDLALFGLANKSVSTNEPAFSFSKDGSTFGRKVKQDVRGIAQDKLHYCPHCPDEAGYAGASGLWYHMKSRHNSVTRPYNKSPQKW